MSSCQLHLVLLQNGGGVISSLAVSYDFATVEVSWNSESWQNLIYPLIEQKKTKNTWRLLQQHYCWHLTKAHRCWQRVTNCKLFHFTTPSSLYFKNFEFPPDSPNPAEVPPVNSARGQHNGEFTLHQVERQEEVKGGLSWGGGGKQERGNVCTLLVLWVFHGGPPLKRLCGSEAG